MTFSTHFTDEPLLLDIVNTLYDLGQGKLEQEHKWAKHYATNYHIEDSHLWKISNGWSIQGIT